MVLSVGVGELKNTKCSLVSLKPPGAQAPAIPWAVDSCREHISKGGVQLKMTLQGFASSSL